MQNRFIFMAFASFLMGCGAKQDLPTVDKLDIQKYIGTWYEIARLPNRFEEGLECVTANYSLKDNGKITVLNKGRKAGDHSKLDEAKGTAWVPDPSEPGKLKVRFFWPFAGDYQVIALDEGYQYALVGDPSRKYLWILSRTPQLDKSIQQDLLGRAKGLGFDTDALIYTDQSCSIEQ